MTTEAGATKGDADGTAPSIEERMARLEEISERYNASTNEGRMLAESVVRLGITAESLNASLGQVDRNQRVLMGVRSDVNEIKEANPRSRVESDSESSRLDSQSSLNRLRVKALAFSASAITAALVLAGAFGMIAYDKIHTEADARTAALASQICHERGRQADTMRTFIKTWEANVMSLSGTPAAYKAQMAIAYKTMLEGYGPVNCSMLSQ